MIEPSDNTLVRVRGLTKYFPVRHGLLGRVQDHVRAVDGVDFTVQRGKTLGLVGESGSGKTTVGRTLLKLIEPTAGEVLFDGNNVFSLSGQSLRAIRRRMQIIFQDPAGSLNPRMTVGQIVGEPLTVHGVGNRRDRRERVGQLLEQVGLAPQYASRYPHEFSGGQRQRIGIARALASEPDFIVCDEPVSALDVSVRAQILNLLKDLQAQLGLSYLFIAHDLAVVEHFADAVAVMYLGHIVEIADKETILAGGATYDRLKHPYTHSLLSAVPQINPALRRDRIRLPGEIPSPIHPPSGCTFHPRCPLTRELATGASESDTETIQSLGAPLRVMKRCVVETPSLQPVSGDRNHCHACLMRQE